MAAGLSPRAARSRMSQVVRRTVSSRGRATWSLRQDPHRRWCRRSRGKTWTNSPQHGVVDRTTADLEPAQADSRELREGDVIRTALRPAELGVYDACCESSGLSLIGLDEIRMTDFMLRIGASGLARPSGGTRSPGGRAAGCGPPGSCAAARSSAPGPRPSQTGSIAATARSGWKGDIALL